MRVSNKNARNNIQSLSEFRANNLYAENRGKFYVVFSYGPHWPLWAYDRVNDRWYENIDKYSVTTSKHKSQTRPIEDGSTITLTVELLRNVIFGGE